MTGYGTGFVGAVLAALVGVGCGGAGATTDRTADERWVEFSEGRSFMRVPEGTLGHSAEVSGRMGELVRCAPTTSLVDNQTVELRLRLDAQGVHLDSVHRDEESTGLADCVEETVQTWQIRDLPSGDELVIPLQFGLLDDR